MKVEAELLKTRIITKRPSLRPFSGFVRQAIPVCRWWIYVNSLVAM